MKGFCKFKMSFLSLLLVAVIFAGIASPGFRIRAATTFDEQLKSFPASYQNALKQLHAVYPNWSFHAENMSMTLEAAANDELMHKQVSGSSGISWRSMGIGGYDWEKNTWVSNNGGWYAASREIIMYYLDPRNFLSAKNVFTYMQLSYDATRQTKEGLQKIITGTFLEKGYFDSKDTKYGGNYSTVIMEAAKQSGVSPYVIAATIIQEQGSGGASVLITGTNENYPGYYNFFNVKASGSTSAEVVKNGLSYAKSMGWTTRSASIIGGAQFFGKNYIAIGQDTYFYMNYNLKNTSSLWHQYAQAVHNAVSSGTILSKSYIDLKSMQLDFKIPVFKNMPSAAVGCPCSDNKKNNYYFNKISIPGLTPTYSRTTYNYDLSVSGNSTVGLSVPTGAVYKGAVSYQPKAGENRITLPIQSETGYINNYIINVASSAAFKLSVDASGGAGINQITVLKGDANGDGKITLIDLANVQRHLLKLIVLSDNNYTGADTNGDGKITLIDLANIQRHLLGIKLLTK